MSFENFKQNIFMAVYAWTKIPLVGFCSPKIIENSSEKTVIKIPLGYKTRNHLKSMYFGALAIGSELSVALLAAQKTEEFKKTKGMRIDFVFKDYKADFLKRPEGDVHFVCEETQAVQHLLEQAALTDERLEKTMTGYAVVPSKNPSEKVLTYTLTLSVKRRIKK